MDITYSLLIQEDIAQLQAAERAARDKTRADRVRMLRFLKEGRVAGGRAAAEVLRATVSEPFSAGGSAIAKTAWQGCWRRRSGAAWWNASRRKRGKACRRRCGP